MSGLANPGDEQILCVGKLNGSIINTKNIQQINVSGTLSGIINFNTEIRNNINNDINQYFELTNVSGTLFNINYGQDKNLTHIIDLQQTHIIGRELLADKNPLLGKNLHLAPSAINKELVLQPVQWDIVEYQISVTDTDSVIQSKPNNFIPPIIRPTLNNINNNETIPTLYKTRLATPGYINEVSHTYSLKKTNETQQIETKKQINEYYAFIFLNKVEILLNINPTQYLEDGMGNFIGPIKQYSQLIDILNQYAAVNNIILKQISEYEFELV